MIKTITNLLWPILILALAPSVKCESASDDMPIETAQHKYSNHLVNENSPYLLAHAHNPVDWYPWGEAALARAKELDRPIFLSIGYSACHWCHVMERESFENEAVAQILNASFVSIKVDREARPDLDQIYMEFTTALTGGGGWPMSVFLTPELKPFFAGTYFPPEDRYGRPGFKRLLTQIATAYEKDKSEIINSAETIYSRMSSQLAVGNRQVPLTKDMITGGARALMRSFDHTYGGFGNDRKFPHATELSLFLRHFDHTGDSAFLKAANQGLMAMYEGGLRDHIGGGFARYSVDRQWLVPHFEKMLYDNALLVMTYAEAYQLTGKKEYLDAVRTTLDFMLLEMRDETGAFYSALDADSEGEEGKFYVWSKAEIDQVLGDDAQLFNSYYGVTETGNFEGHNIIRLNKRSAEFKGRTGLDNWDEWLLGCQKRLFEARSKRVRPLTDDKILTSWNGLALSALVKGYQITEDKRYLEAAIKNAQFVNDKLYNDGKLTHAYRQGISSTGTFLEDYAYYCAGLVELYQVDHNQAELWLEMARTMALAAIKFFMADDGTLYLRQAGLEDLILRPKDEFDGALPSVGSVLLGSLLKLNRLTEDSRLLTAAEKGLEAISGKIKQRPGSMASALLALDYYYGEKIEIIIVGNSDERALMVKEINRRYLPNKVIAISDHGLEKSPLFVGRESKNGELSAYVCRNSACLLPALSVAELASQLDQLQ